MRNIDSFIIHVVSNLFPLLEYSEGEINRLMDKFKEEADDLNIEISDEQLRKYIERFDQLKNSPKITEKDLRKYPLPKLIKLVTSSEGAEVEKEDDTPDVVYSGEGITIWNGAKEGNCINYGSGERWCITRGSYSNYRYSEGRGYPTFYLAKNANLADYEPLSFVAIQVRDISYEDERYVYTNRVNSPHESRPMNFSGLLSEVPWLRDIPNIKGILKYIPLSSAEKATQVYKNKDISIREWVNLPFSAKKQYLVVKQGSREIFSDISNDEFVSKYLPKYPQIATFIAITPGILPSLTLLKNLDKFSNNDRKSITANLRDLIPTRLLEDETFPFDVKKLLVLLKKWELTSDERLYVTKDGSTIVKLTFKDPVRLGIYTEEDSFPSIKLNKRTSKYLLEYPDLDNIPFNSLLRLVGDEVLDFSFVQKVIKKAEEDPDSAIIVKDIEGGKLLLDSNSFTSYKIEGDKVTPVSFSSEEVQNVLKDETENTNFQDSAVNLVFDQKDLPTRINKDAFINILKNTPYNKRTRGNEVILVDPDTPMIFVVNTNNKSSISTIFDYGNRGREWNSYDTSNSFTPSLFKVYFDYLRSQNISYSDQELVNYIDRVYNTERKKAVIAANPPMDTTSRYRPAVIDNEAYLVNTQNTRDSKKLSRLGRLVKASLNPDVLRTLRAAAGEEEPAEEPAAPTAPAARRTRQPRQAAQAAPAAGGNEGVRTAIANAGLTNGFNSLANSIKERILAGTITPYTRRNAAVEAIGRVTTMVTNGPSRFYILTLPSGRVIGFATMQPDARHYIVTANTSYRVPRVSALANTLRANNINEAMKTLIKVHAAAMPEEVNEMKKLLKSLKNKKK